MESSTVSNEIIKENIEESHPPKKTRGVSFDETESAGVGENIPRNTKKNKSRTNTKENLEEIAESNENASVPTSATPKQKNNTRSKNDSTTPHTQQKTKTTETNDQQTLTPPPNGQDMYVTKRTGKKEMMSFDKILKRIKKSGTEVGIKINYTSISIKIIEQLFDGISTTKIDELTAEQCASMSSLHPSYKILAGRILISNHHKNTDSSFTKVMKKLFNYTDKNGKHLPLISEETWKTISTNAEYLDSLCDYSRDYLIDYFGFKTLEKTYLMRINGKVVERPQHMWMRVAVGIHGTNLERVVQTYTYMSQKYFIHATPTLFNAGTPRPQCSSCFLLAMEDDSIDGIYNTLKDCALISKYAGGIGLHIHNIRAAGSHIYGTNGSSNGIVPMLRVFNNTAKYVDQGGGKRNGSFAIYLEIWHADIESFLEMRKNHGDEELKARDLFYALWMCDLFMKRVKNNDKWTLMCPNECKGLSDVYGDEFEKLYTKYENENRGRKTISARDLWYKILDAQMETGTPYISYKDAANRKSNQKNIGIIKSSNLCQEIMEVSNETETAVCFTGDTRILTDDGYMRIDECDDKWVYSYFADDIHFKEKGQFVNAKLINNGLKNVYRLETYEGNVVKCTANHLFVVSQGTNFEWKKLCELTINDIVVMFSKETNAMFLTNIKSMCYVGIEPVYDLFVENTHNYVAEGYIVHNCNLSSIGLPTFVDRSTTPPIFDFEKLHEISKIVTYNLNKVIDINYYPTEKTRLSNTRHRPIGIGIQGLADVFIMMGFPFDSPEARTLNRHIFETIYHGALVQSMEMAIAEGKYSSFDGSPASQGLLQFDLWGVENHSNERYNWTDLKEQIKIHGLRNSLLLAPMPTASTSQILGYNECFEPITSNIYTRRTMAGEFIVANTYLMNDLIDLGLWNEQIKNHMVINNGSIQTIPNIPQYIKDRYRTVWEIPMKSLIDMSADRGIYICQSQSLNLWLEDPNYNSLTAMHFYSWSKGLKTGIYYLRRRAKHNAQQFTIEPEKNESKQSAEEKTEVCEMCSS